MPGPSASVKLMLVRHGETTGNVGLIVQGQADYPLNSNGERQAREVAAKLRDSDIDVAFSSPLSRARVTAEEIMRFHGGVPLGLAPELSEIDAGAYTHRVCSSKAEVYDYGMIRALEQGGESLEQFQKRVHDFVTQVARDNDGKTVLVVSHGGTTMALLNAFRGNPAPEMMHIEPPANTEVLEMELRV